jgi:N-acetyl-anhydromuramyl-L-alanine amidase AmpD
VDDTDRTPEFEGETGTEPEVPSTIDPNDREAIDRFMEEMQQEEASQGPGGLAPGAARAATRSVPLVKVVDLTSKTPTSVYNNRPNGKESIAGILLHHTGSPSEEGDIFYLSHSHANPVSTHKVFRRDGTIVKLVPDDKRAWHAGASRWRDFTDCNDTMIGYEICNRGNGEDYTAAQYESIAQSIAYDCALYHIPDRNVTTHRQVRDEYLKVHPGKAAKKNDPFGLDLDRLWNRVREIRANWPPEWGIPLWSNP